MRENGGGGPACGPWYVAPGLEESASTPLLLRTRSRLGTGLIVALGSLGLVACGGGERQDADEPEGEFPVAIVSAEFPAKQRLAQTSNLLLSVRNDSDEPIPDLAITINTRRQLDAGEVEVTETIEETDESVTIAEEDLTEEETTITEEEESGPIANGPFSVISEQPDLAIPSRPVWILEESYPRLVGEDESAGAEAAQTNTFAFGELEPGETIEIDWKVTPVQAGNYVIDYELAAGLQGNAVAVTDDGSVPEGEFVVRITAVPPQTRVNDAGKVVPIRKSDIIGQAGSEEQRQELDD